MELTEGLETALPDFQQVKPEGWRKTPVSRRQGSPLALAPGLGLTTRVGLL